MDASKSASGFFAALPFCADLVCFSSISRFDFSAKRWTIRGVSPMSVMLIFSRDIRGRLMMVSVVLDMIVSLCVLMFTLTLLH